MEQGQKLQKTIYYQEFLDEARRNPFTGFENSPIREVRLECLKAIRDRCYVYPDWAESCIRALYENNDSLKDDVLSWYLFSLCRDDSIIRAINFVLSLRENKDCSKWLSDNTVSKFITGILFGGAYTKNLYPALPALRAFLVELLCELKRPFAKNNGYLSHNWHCAERALRIIVAAKDYSFLPLIDELILMHQQGIIWPAEDTPFYRREVNVAALKEAKRILRAAR